jgi:ribonuclease E
MSKEIYISSTPHETRLAIVEKDELTEIYYERENEYTLAGSIYNGRVTRVLPGMQSSFVDIGLERDAFLYITDFMEEAGDSADFEGASNSSSEPRASRSEASHSESGRAEGNRQEGSRPEGSRSENDSSDRRSRGRRDGRSRDGRNRDAAPAPTAETEASFEEARTFAPTDDETADLAPLSTDTDEIGEGAPGADGSRRWRGRRGRRRGRGEASPNAPQTEASQASETTEAFVDTTPREINPREVEPRSERTPREGRGRDRNRGDRGDHGPRDSRHDAVRERFAPRSGIRPTFSNDETVDLTAASTPEAEPFILPGESLSKYRRGDDGQPVEAPKPLGTLIAPKPSSEVTLTGWDGGAVLPGETLRRREPSAEVRSGEPRRAHFENREGRSNQSRDQAGDKGRERRRDRDRGRNRETFRPEPSTTLDPAEAVQPAVTSAHDTGEREYVPSFETVLEPIYETQTEALPTEEEIIHPNLEALVEELHEAAAEFHEAEFHETTADYEPGEDAFASYRVDSAGTREFRQSAPIEDTELVEEQATGGQIAQAELVEEEADFPTAPAASSETDSANEGTEHDFTSIQPTGEMLSEVEEPLNREANAAAPIEHEGAIQSVTLEEAHHHAQPTPAAAAASIGEDHGFAPGDGQLEEELLDDDEFEVGTLHASAFDDDTEEETLENVAEHGPDLGSMIRDMSIDDITRPEPADADEDDDEEDHFEDEEDFEEDELESTGEEDTDEELSSSDVDESDKEEESAEEASYDEEGNALPRAARTVPDATPREGGRRNRRGGRRDGRERGNRDSERSPSDRVPDRNADHNEDHNTERNADSRAERSPERHSETRTERPSGDRDRSSGDRGHRDRRGMAGSRSSSGGDRRGYGGGSRNTQAANLPAISDLLKPGQEVLVQIAKEPIAKKGARITSHIALPGRFLVFMPTVSHTGVSRKIESDSERRRLKEILLSERGDAQGGFIVRTAAAGATEEELRSDLRFLLNLWADIKTRSESSKSPALIYHDLNLIERILRDQVTDNFSAIWCDTEAEYERVLRFLQRFQPSLIRRVKLYTKDTPLFEQFGITEEINKALRSKVWLKSGGSIVINQTEALVAIDINTGKFVGKTTKLEDTIVKTNLDSIPEIVRQIRLRDLGGIIIIDFIDMDERKNRNKVMAALEEELKKDRAPSKVLQFNDFGLVAITRKRVKQSLERTLSTTCAICQGTGMTKSPVTVCNDIYIEMRKMHRIIEKGDIMLRVHPEVVKQLKLGGGKWLQEMEEMSGKTILVKSDPSLHPEQFDIH